MTNVVLQNTETKDTVSSLLGVEGGGTHHSQYRCVDFSCMHIITEKVFTEEELLRVKHNKK